MHDALKTKHYSVHTESSYADCVRQVAHRAAQSTESSVLPRRVSMTIRYSIKSADGVYRRSQIKGASS